MARILAIDDDPQFGSLLVEQLRRLGHESQNAMTLHAGLAMVHSFEPELVFLDVSLPDGDGLSAIKKIKLAPSSPEVIIVTAEGQEDGAVLAINSGAWDYLQKGHTIKDLLLPIAHAVEYRLERLSASQKQAMDLAGIVGESTTMKECYNLLAQAASDPNNTLITGETGTGKELFARAIHRNSARNDKPFVVVDCAALPESLVESLLFGHLKGAFTGAERDQPGLIKQAGGGILFLDEIGELPLIIQKTFLRVLQEKRFRPVGSEKEVSSDFQLICATNRDLNLMADEGSFRKDLLFRVRTHVIALPPLRDRDRDVVVVAKTLIAKICDRAKISLKGASRGFFQVLEEYNWPGNVRELVHAVEHAVASARHHEVLQPVHLPTAIRASVAKMGVKPDLDSPLFQADSGLPQLQEARHSAEIAYLNKLLLTTEGDINKACQIAGISRARLYGLIKQHGINRKQGD